MARALDGFNIPTQAYGLGLTALAVAYLSIATLVDLRAAKLSIRPVPIVFRGLKVPAAPSTPL